MNLKKISTTIIADSIDKKNNRITSMILEVPQIIVKELLRHRMFSFSSSSMRAIPFNKVLNDTKENMFIPYAFQRHHSGMQGSEYLIGEELDQAKNKWIETGLNACKEAEELYNKGISKQLCSRIIEPYGYAKILLTATEFENFFNLRCPIYKGKTQNWRSWKDVVNHAKKENPGLVEDLESYSTIKRLENSISGAEIHMQVLAESMWDAYQESIPKELEAGEWHIPFGNKIYSENGIEEVLYNHTKEGWVSAEGHDLELDKIAIQIATARCARLSYMTFDNKIDYEKDIELHDTLLNSMHFSPFEHIARVMSDNEYYSFIKGKVPSQQDQWGFFNEEFYPVIFKNGNELEFVSEDKRFGWCNNFRGFIQQRYFLENEKHVGNGF